MPLVIGEVLAHYRIAERLGEGGMGEVFRAEDLKLRRPVALKVLRGAEDQEGCLLREARFASQLNHPNIAVVYDVDTVEREGRRRSFIAMEYVAGRTLSALLKERTPTVPETVDLALQVADALAAAHARGVVHRDIKPGNVMVDGAGRVKVLDFGLAASGALTAGFEARCRPAASSVTTRSCSAKRSPRLRSEPRFQRLVGPRAPDELGRLRWYL
jgi:eukaryotic-like serine/threonine-protein kinase